MVGSGCGKGVLGDVDVTTDVVFEIHLAGTVNHGRGAVAPENLDLRAVGRTWRVGVGDDGELVGETGNIHVADLARTLVRGERCRCRDCKSDDYQQNT